MRKYLLLCAVFAMLMFTACGGTDVFAHFYAMLETYPQINYDMISIFSPAFALYFITLIEGLPLLGIDADYSVDTYIFDFAEANNRQIAGLNTVLRELELGLDMPDDVAISAFEEFPDFAQFKEDTLNMNMVEAYEAQDAEWLYRETIRPLVEEAANSLYGQFMYETTILARCAIFAAEIERLLRETQEPTTFFITMGALHVLYGHIFDSLENSGFEVVSLWDN
ncbi:MAG: TraB/GumN family protein [Defluviitaleaceae bacterium]|nr:TraB/GumN family protein [Defluviitaleaceae bacterium]MCL2262769.1 TraB/GumN family protein [Defluviitaleaceae bacterium]